MVHQIAHQKCLNGPLKVGEHQLGLPFTALQDLLNQVGNHRLSTASADGDIGGEYHLNGSSADRKLAVLSTLSACRLLPYKTS
jgi:hypothetical protein